jgi:hypothetical protein
MRYESLHPFHVIFIFTKANLEAVELFNTRSVLTQRPFADGLLEITFVSVPSILGKELITLYNKTTADEGNLESIENLGYFTERLTEEERNELMAEGKAEGLAEGRAETEAILLKSVKFQLSINLTPDEISSILGIPVQKVLEIKQILDSEL